MPDDLPYRDGEDRAAADRFWQGREAGRPLFEAAVRFLEACGPCVVSASHSRLTLTAKTRFMWCPIAHTDGSIALRFLSPKPIHSPRLRVDPLSGRWSHRVKLHSMVDLDEEVLAWLRASLAWGSTQPS